MNSLLLSYTQATYDTGWYSGFQEGVNRVLGILKSDHGIIVADPILAKINLESYYELQREAIRKRETIRKRIEEETEQ